MAKSLKELVNDPHFGLKLVVLVVGILVNFYFLNLRISSTYTSILINGYHFSFLTVIGSLVLACICFEATAITEMCLLVAALVKLLMVTSYADSNYALWESQYGVLRDDDKYYMFMTANIGSMVLIAIDIILRAGEQ